MTATMVFVHGRGQEGKNPDKLVRDWRAGLAAGLAQAGRPSLDDSPVAFPFFGDELFRVTAELARSGHPIELEALPADGSGAMPFHPLVTTDVGELERRLIADMAEASGSVNTVERESLLDNLQRTLSWRPAREALEWLARFSRVDREIIKAFLRDVAVYLTRGRQPVLDIVRAAVPASGPIVLVSHSLGTVVARDLLDDANIRGRTRLWVTAGAPLALPTVQKNLLTPGPHNPGVPWVTAYDANDIVALGHPLHRAWGDPLVDVPVENGDRPHAIDRYLGHADVARAIHDAVTAA
jgi:hypothetical protein